MNKMNSINIKLMLNKHLALVKIENSWVGANLRQNIRFLKILRERERKIERERKRDKRYLSCVASFP